jgi:hypothetical protein
MRLRTWPAAVDVFRGAAIAAVLVAGCGGAEPPASIDQPDDAPDAAPATPPPHEDASGFAAERADPAPAPVVDARPAGSETARPPTATGAWPPPGAAWWASWDSSDPLDGGKFRRAPWNWQSATPRVVDGNLRVELPPNGAQMPAAGAQPGSGSRRCELEPALPGSMNPSPGRTVYHRWDLTLVNFPVNTTSWNVLTQWKQDGTGSPPVELSVERGRWKLIIHDAGGDIVGSHDVGPAEQGKAVTLVIGVLFGTSGHLTAYHDGSKTLDVAAPTMHAGKGSYLKSPGIYASSALSGPLSVEVARMAVGPTYESVAR